MEKYKENRRKTLVREATPYDAYFLSHRLRRSDITELRASSGLSPAAALTGGLKASRPNTWTLAVRESDTPLAMGGVCPLLNNNPDINSEGVGIIWMLCSEAVSRYPKELHRHSKELLTAIWETTAYTTLCNAVYVENAASISWLKRLGFIFVFHNVPIGHYGDLFHVFALRRKGVDNV